MVGKTISHYKVLEKIGEGGMGEVYRATDTKLNRDVALKILPERFASDPQRLARFEREAKLLASLNHPNIAAIYGFEEADDVRFLALELVPGETLQERVAKGPLPVEEALEVCRQIAEGVEAAHEKGVIHRDLKRYYQNLELSRDDERLAVGRIDSQTGKSDIWLVELSRGIASRLTSDPSDERFPIWSPDGHQILFSSDRRGKPDLYLRTLDSGEEELIVDSPGRNFPRHWTPDGQFILYGSFIRDSPDLWMLPLVGEGKPKPILETPFSQWSARVSPDGRWLAYNSNESGRVEAYIQPFQTPGEKLRLSVNGSGPVSWRGDGKELFYLALDGTMMAVPIQASDAMEPGIPQSLFQTGIATATVLRQFAVTEDGQRFLLLAPLPAESATAITVILNWTASLKR